MKEQNDELNGQIINLSIQGAKSLFTESLSESLAAEINNVSRAEVRADTNTTYSFADTQRFDRQCIACDHVPKKCKIVCVFACS